MDKNIEVREQGDGSLQVTIADKALIQRWRKACGDDCEKKIAERIADFLSRQ